MNVYHGHRHMSGAWGYYETGEYIITANTDSEALGLALEAVPKSTASEWTFDPIDTTKPNAFYVTSYES